ncbi:hypothetical protein [Kamptonema formosum]|uniref:hypothetical protein n=1 Tax=Kamptonema formosum TaxID=331992 RepID=UPI000347DF5D|nr:hypothetical protein [Oscillatoria sp. PCC 10802]
MPNQRLEQLEKILNLEYEKLGEWEIELAMSASPPLKTEMKQRIREQILPSIRKYEAEYWRLLAQEARFCEVPEEDASNAIVEVVREVELIETNSSASHLDNKVIQLLQEILDKLKEPKTPASAKAKLVLPLLPGILSYEMELDTGNGLRRAFQPLGRVLKGALDEKK